MKTLKITSARKVNANLVKDAEFDTYYSVGLDDILVNDAGETMLSPLVIKDGERKGSRDLIPVSEKSLHAALTGYLGIDDVNELSGLQRLQLLRSCTIECSIPYKKEGADWDATEFTERAWTGDAWDEKPKAGKTYKVFRSGHRIDYSKPVVYHFDEELAEKILDKVELRKAREKAVINAVQDSVQAGVQ